MKITFKINSATQQAFTLKLDAAIEIMKYAGITQEDWLLVLFELGCEFVEKNKYISYLWEGLLQNEKLGYWDWWMVLFTEDDHLLTTMNVVNDYNSYYAQKLRMVYSEAADYQFHQFLQRNKKINGKKV